MAIYTVHEPPPRANEAAADPERFVFVRDGFHFWAFLLGGLWMLWRRLWLVFVLYLIVIGALNVGLKFAGASAGLTALANLLLAILVGLEASTLRRWSLGLRRWRTVGVVVADDVEVAERRFFDTWARERPAAAEPAASPPPPAMPPANQAPDVIGLFPEPGIPR